MSAGARDVLELGAGHGRDALYLAGEGFAVHATDFSATGLAQLTASARKAGLSRNVRTTVRDVRDPLLLADACMDAVFAHMLLCMALSTKEIHALVGEVRRVSRPGGGFVCTVRHTADAHYGTGTAHGDGIHEHGGFAVHFLADPVPMGRPRDLCGSRGRPIDALGCATEHAHLFVDRRSLTWPRSCPSCGCGGGAVRTRWSPLRR
ncbi:class I SAM-dependent methyltransferase [Streptomyces sp. NPDC096311]|uniref:class I SAM-dependent methyltransferase n=1 Tax=Streptomyces sp. NPDC096311 TaxID=3366083 RepID=UPI003802283A